MTVKTIYICDKCGNEQDSPHDFWIVDVTARYSTYPNNTFVDNEHLRVCGPCLESFGIHIQTKAVMRKNGNHKEVEIE